MAKSYQVYSGSGFSLKLNLDLSCDESDCLSDYLVDFPMRILFVALYLMFK